VPGALKCGNVRRSKREWSGFWVSAEPVVAADGGRDLGLAEFLVAQRGRRG
jgi:hypothetical protein